MVWVLQVMPRPMDSRKSRLRTSAENQRLRVEVKVLRAEIDKLRGQYESHTHDVYEYDLETGPPK
jgi:hypothetical protein